MAASSSSLIYIVSLRLVWQNAISNKENSKNGTSVLLAEVAVGPEVCCTLNVGISARSVRTGLEWAAHANGHSSAHSMECSLFCSFFFTLSCAFIFPQFPPACASFFSSEGKCCRVGLSPIPDLLKSWLTLTSFSPLSPPPCRGDTPHRNVSSNKLLNLSLLSLFTPLLVSILLPHLFWKNCAENLI